MDYEIIPSTQEKTTVIQPINRDTVHRICSGQVVLSLAIAVKELVENAIDAGATIIDIQLKEYGSEVIEVSDNGSGVEKENFQALTLKHYTSKIQQFEDLTTLSTLGFRGEALSSLCALSDLSILTKHKLAENATRIKYDRNGKIVSETLAAREQGTTVTLQNLFSTLPVRKKEFIKNLKREFNKMCQLLYAYCLLSKGIKFSCTNTTSKGSKNSVVATQGLSTVRDNIINIFGAKQISSLIEVEIVRPSESILAEFGLNLDEEESLPFEFEFFISSVVHGSGRSSSDRQYFYINSRPCEPTKVTKLINEVYKQYNNSQYPFIYLNIISKSSLVDVNVTPDKRQIFLEKEKVLLATLKASLLDSFKSFPSSYKMQNLDISQNVTITDFFESKENKSRGLKRSMTDTGLKKGSILDRFKKRSKSENNQPKTLTPVSSFLEESQIESESEHDKSHEMLDSFIKLAQRIIDNEQESEKDIQTISIKTDNEDIVENLPNCKNEIHLIEEVKIACVNDRQAEKLIDINPKITVFKNESKGDSTPNKENKSSKEILSLDADISINELDLTLDSVSRDPINFPSSTISVSIDDIKNLLKKKTEIKNDDVRVRFRSKINPADNKSAEDELRKQISKEDFAKMEIIGQFNLGFIITKLNNDLFIIDQHATDEKYNFENLQANTVMENQVLVHPKPLQLTAANECLLIENEDIFKKNGFTFKIDESAPCTKKVLLTSVPLSKSIIFGKDDIDEMLFMLQDSNHTMCRPSRIRGMFASRACRKSVMFGKALSKSDMRKLVNHMGEIEQPWNCPHGRPTMRHLLNLDLLH